MVLEARLSEMEAQLCTVENVVSQVPLVSAEPPSIASSISCPLVEPEQPGWLGNWQEEEA